MSENTPKIDIESAYREAMRGKDNPGEGLITIPGIGFVQLGPHEMGIIYLTPVREPCIIET